MENCLSKNKDINVVYTINEPAAAGARHALKAAGKQRRCIIVSVDGGKAGVSRPGRHHRRHLPAVPAEDGRARRRGHRRVVKGGTKPTTTPGSRLLRHRGHADRQGPLRGVASKDPAYGFENAWG